MSSSGAVQAAGLGEERHVEASEVLRNEVTVVGAHGDDRHRRGEHVGGERASTMAADVNAA